jgi:integrase
MPLTKRGNTWYVHFFTPDGKRIRQSTGTVDKKEAQEFHDRLKAQYWRSESLGDKTEYAWKEAVVRFLEETNSKASHADDIQRLRWLDKYLGENTLTEITPSVIAKIGNLKRRETSASTANRHLALISVILRKAAREWEWIENAPAVRLFKEAKRRIRWLTGGEAAVLLRELPDHLLNMAQFTLATGLRMTNVTQLEWSQIDMQRRVAWIHPDQAKSRKAIVVPLNDDSLGVLRRQIGKHHHFVFTYKGNPVGRANSKAWRNALKRSGIKNFRWHDLRHTWASWHVQAGTPLHVLQELGGWESVEMVRRYAHLGADHLAGYANNVLSSYDTNTTQSELMVAGHGL